MNTTRHNTEDGTTTDTTPLCCHCDRPLHQPPNDSTLIQTQPGGPQYWWHTECYNRQYPQEKT